MRIQSAGLYERDHGCPLAQTDPINLPLGNQIGQSSDRFLNGAVFLDPVNIIEVDPFNPQSPQRRLATSAGIGGAVVDAAAILSRFADDPEFCGNLNIRPLLAQKLTQQHFIVMRSIHVGGVKEINAQIDRRRKHLHGGFIIARAVKLGHSHTAQAQCRHAETHRQNSFFHYFLNFLLVLYARHVQDIESHNAAATYSANCGEEISAIGKRIDKRLVWDDAKVFLAVMRTGTLSAAATELGLGLATVSRRIDRLEHALNVALFTRQQSGYTLTADGEQLVPSATAMEAAAASLRRSAKQRADIAGTVRLGVFHLAGRARRGLHGQRPGRRGGRIGRPGLPGP